MNCHEFEQSIEAYVEGFPDDDLKRTMDDHRASCANCARLAKAHALVMKSLSHPAPVEAPRGLTERILARIEAESTAAASAEAPGMQKVPAIDCGTFGEHIAAYTNGLADETLGKRLDEHRAACTSCDRLTRAHEFVLATLSATEPVPAPRGLRSRILAAVEMYRAESLETAAARPYPRFGMIAASAAAVGSLAASVIFIGKLFIRNAAGISAGVEQIGTLGAVIQSSKTSVVMAAYMLQGYVQGWYASMQPRIPEQVLYLLSLVTGPIEIPYLSLSLPVYTLLAFGALPFVMRKYFCDSVYSPVSAK